MPRLKLYTLGRYGFVRPQVIEAIGEAPHVRQATVCLIAHTKAEAVEVAAAVGLYVSPNSEDFRQNVGWPFGDSLLASFTEPVIVATPNLPRTGSPVVRLDGAEQVPRLIGHVGQTEQRQSSFIPLEEQ